MPFAIPSMLFHRRAVLRSPRFFEIPFPRYADQCFSASWWRNSIPTRICAVLFHRFAVRFRANPAQIKSFQRPRRLNTSRTNSGAVLGSCHFNSLAVRPEQSRIRPSRSDSIPVLVSYMLFLSGAGLCSYAAFVSLVFWAVAMRRVGLHFRSGAVRTMLIQCQSTLFRCGYSSTNSTLQPGAAKPPTML